LSPSQLAAGWLDIKNTGFWIVNLAGVELTNLTYSPSEQKGLRKSVMTFPHLLLAPGEALRVHAGEERDVNTIRAVDRTGAEIHVFTGQNEHFWHGVQGGTAALWDVQKKRIDGASYHPNTPAEVILVRVGDCLLVPYVSSRYCYG
jgi:hypothetical protein